MRSFLAALSFLTILPIRFREPLAQQCLARSRFWYPVVGLLLGAVLGGWTALMARLGSSALGAFLVLTAWIVLTGALHIDGFCDLCDGLFGGQTAEERLRIMKDPHVGTFGLVSAVVLLLGKFVVLAEAFVRLGEYGPWAVGAAVGVARCLALLMAGVGRYPRPAGTGKILIEATTPWEAASFTLIGGAGSFAVLFPAGLLGALVPFFAALLVVLGLTELCRRRLGGITGDCLGAAIEASELTFLLAAVVSKIG